MTINNKGFTLIEFCVVAAVIVIAMTIAISAGIASFPDYRLKTAANDLLVAMQEAKMTAIRNNTQCALVFNPAQNSYRILSDPGPDDAWGTGDDNQPAPGPDGVYGNADDVAEKPAVSLVNYGSGVRYGNGNATIDLGGGNTFGGNGITYQNDIVVFNSRGMLLNAGTIGYVYLANNINSCYGIGTPTVTGNIVMQKWYNSNGSWESN